MRKKEELLQGVWDGLSLFALSFAAGVCTGFGFGGGVLCAAACAVFGVVFGRAYRPDWLTILPVFCVTYRFGAAAGAAAVLLAGVFSFFLSLQPQPFARRLRHPSIRAGLIPGLAFLTTALQTDNYFGIGAVGGEFWEMLRDYISRGFHPNWRGILYGTIAMVILITYPRKFKQLSRKVSAPFAAVLVTFVLHLLLVPDALYSPVNEAGAFTLRTILSASPLGGVSGSVWQILCAALALALLLTAPLPAGECRRLSPVLLCAGAAGGVPMTTEGGERSRLSALVCAAVTAALYLCPGLDRMPVHTLAVILIVTAWQAVDRQAVKAACTSGAGSVALFACGLLLPSLIGVQYALPLLTALSVCTQKKGSRNDIIDKTMT